ncbi:DegT/DnrJ/EryC1/StrS family aminotransferase [Ruegeria sp. ANG-S4]|uniref:DegT/DnrJ/EryC1/StrS family aminotransferase n=1 Tax=Ruegeria sp. ANG-S4 TaxID=1577904 RepID=UPI001F4CA20B|nr:DegT/DnrJ/EryC1/StrS family aminotransferase [Ruegeria sp. ANG-S4]
MESMWESRILTNNGPIARKFETELGEYLGVPSPRVVANCTLGLVIALRALGVTGEVITSPFSFVATTNAIIMAGAQPVFADIDPVTLNISPSAVERLISPKTEAVLGIHSFGNPCNLAELHALAERHGIPLVYDAAHAFGVRVGARSLLDYGTCAVTSFHATKVFNTLEGGAVFSRDPALLKRVDALINHGFEGETNVLNWGINAKMSELHAAVGLEQLPYVTGNIKARGKLVNQYIDGLSGIEGLSFARPPADVTTNHYLFPVMVDQSYPLSRDALNDFLAQHNIFARRYFYPLISDMQPYRDLPSAVPQTLPVAQDIAARILCLPLFPELDPTDQNWVISLLRDPSC